MANVGGNTVKEITELASKRDYELNKYPIHAKDLRDFRTIHFKRCRKKKQVEAIVNLMTTHEPPGIDKIPVRIIKDCLPYYCLLSRLLFLRHQYIPRSMEAG